MIRNYKLAIDYRKLSTGVTGLWAYRFTGKPKKEDRSQKVVGYDLCDLGGKVSMAYHTSHIRKIKPNTSVSQSEILIPQSKIGKRVNRLTGEP